jgi:hypothetical protein
MTLKKLILMLSLTASYAQASLFTRFTNSTSQAVRLACRRLSERSFFPTPATLTNSSHQVVRSERNNGKTIATITFSGTPAQIKNAQMIAAYFETVSQKFNIADKIKIAEKNLGALLREEKSLITQHTLNNLGYDAWREVQYVLGETDALCDTLHGLHGEKDFLDKQMQDLSKQINDSLLRHHGA